VLVLCLLDKSPSHYNPRNHPAYVLVYVDHDVVLAPRQQVDVLVRSTLRSVRVSEGEHWLLESRQLRPVVHLARTLLPDKRRDISVRVVNTTSEP